MLWSAADYKLPANQEPALTEELENMLISMTQDSPWVRPTANDVLQVLTLIIKLLIWYVMICESVDPMTVLSKKFYFE